MDKFVIKGGCHLDGEVKIQGAKNSILAILAASLLTEGECKIEQVPLLEDVYVMIEVLRHYGSKLAWQGGALLIDNRNVEPKPPPEDLIRRLRASNLILAPLLARFGEAELPLPGGCAIGSRPMNYHLAALSSLGADVSTQTGLITAKAARLCGNKIYLDFPSVGATENAMMAATLAKGETHIYNAAREPEIIDIAVFLTKMGARIRGAGTDCIFIEGVHGLHGAEHEVITDRIEASTLLVAGSLCANDLLVMGCSGGCCEALLAKLAEAGINVKEDARGLRVRSNRKLRSVDVRTMPYPGFPTDMQPQFMALMSVAKGSSIITESIFENRFRHVTEMRRMGADIKIIGDSAVIKGKPLLHGARVEATDLRAGAALVLMGLVSEGETIVEQVQHIDRGYQSLETTLQNLGADIRRVD